MATERPACLGDTAIDSCLTQENLRALGATLVPGTFETCPTCGHIRARRVYFAPLGEAA